MNYNELIEKHTNEEGVLNKEELAKDLENSTQEQLNAVSAKTKNKYKTQLSEKEQELEEFKKTTKTQEEKNSEKDEMVTNLLNEIHKINDKLEKNEQKQGFIKKAKENNVDENIYNQLINSGADLDKIDLEIFKKQETATVPDMGIKEEKQNEELQNKEKSLLEALKWEGKKK